MNRLLCMVIVVPAVPKSASGAIEDICYLLDQATGPSARCAHHTCPNTSSRHYQGNLQSPLVAARRVCYVEMSVGFFAFVTSFMLFFWISSYRRSQKTTK
ncbi:hypothetical protein C8J57DRAFT_1313554 [Mycena rebaudengoi]|nr:hypothetical protein C8J57DRAFT_1313554 [Mycena rebaudengoi]